MSCNNDFFISEESVIKDTYLSRLPSNIDYIIYRGGNHTSYDEKTHILTVESNDSLERSFNKTYCAFKWVYKNKEFDYIFRTNTSTYVNIDLLNYFVNNKENDFCVWGGEIFYGLNNECTDINMAYLRGNGILLNKNHIYVILSEGIPLLYFNLKMVDDSSMGLLLNTYAIYHIDRNYLNIIQSFRYGWYKSTLTPYANHQLCNMCNTNKDFDFLKTLMYIQIKNWYDRSLEKQHFYEIDEVFKNNKDLDLKQTFNMQFDYSLNPDVFLGEQYGYSKFHDLFISKKDD